MKVLKLFVFFCRMSESSCVSVASMDATVCKKVFLENGSHSLGLMKKAVVVLTRLPEFKISALRPPTPQQFYSEDESLSSSDSDMQWEPEDDSSDSDFSLSNKQKAIKPTKSDPPPPPSAPSSSNNNSNKSGKATKRKSKVKRTYHYLLAVYIALFLRFSFVWQGWPL